MNLKKETVSIIAAAVLIILMILLLCLGVLSLSDVGAALTLVVITTFFGVLWWGWRERVERRLKGPTEPEMESLIKPLYLKFDENPTIPSDLYRGLVHLLSLPPDYWNKPIYQKSQDSDIVNSVIDIMRQHCELAQPQLRKLIARYLEIRRKHREHKEPYGAGNDQMYYVDAYKVVDEIAALVKTRYKDLVKM